MDSITELADIGIIGLGVMGRSLALNLRDKGTRVAAYDAWPDALRTLSGEAGDRLALHERLDHLVAALARPRNLLLMVKAGAPVERQLDRLMPLLTAGDSVIDGGNSHFEDSLRRAAKLEAQGVAFLGAGISGGERGARKGASIMVGGEPEAYRRLEPLLTALAAEVEDEPCCAHVGGDGAGHFVKMVHNGIEYAVMQLLAEAYLLLTGAGQEPATIGERFAAWNEGPLGSYLLEISADILGRQDADSDAALVDIVRDSAGQKGTGTWTAAAALALGVPVPTLAAAVAARGLSSLLDERRQARDVLPGPKAERPDAEPLAADLRDALEAATIVAYAQGFALIAAAATHYGWNTELARIAAIWRGGCIVRSKLLTPIRAFFAAEPQAPNLLLAPALRDSLTACQAGWRRSVSLAAISGIPAPALSSALAYYDGYRAGRVGANLIQAQRDYFGAHGFARTDREGTFHGPWSETSGSKTAGSKTAGSKTAGSKTAGSKTAGSET